MATQDGVTRWWRSISLRAKVTGVTVMVLMVGLVTAGVGTGLFLRNALIATQDAQLSDRAGSDLLAGLIQVDETETGITISLSPAAAGSDYSVAIYFGDGTPVPSAPSTRPGPTFPQSFSLERATILGTAPFDLKNQQTGARYRASAGTFEIPGVPQYLTQVVALPLAPIDRIVAQFSGIFSALALVIIAIGALGTRWLVTQAFRRLGQVEDTAMSIAGGDFSQRLTDIEPGTEVGRLKLAINTMLNRVDASLRQRDAAVQRMRRFIGDASHELRTPLVTVRGYAELYRIGAIQGEEDTAAAMERIEKEAMRMGVLVEDLLALARLDEEREILFTAIDLRPLARDAAMDARAAEPSRTITVIDTTSAAEGAPGAEAGGTEAGTVTAGPDGIVRAPEGVAGPKHPPTGAIAFAGATLSRLRRRPRAVPPNTANAPGAEAVGILPGAGTEAAPAEAALAGAGAASTALPPIVMGDENRVRQVVANLIGNARRFTGDGSPIEILIGVDAETQTGWIAISDHGEGVPEPIREHIFERFWRADTSRARETGGSGLGLAIVASIVKALHGTVVVEETPGGGATFKVSLPLATRTGLPGGALGPVQRGGFDPA
ncbi:MAG: HAMP domain-containing histidine kinase [Microthrixaceae bacterium]|nr:HAMP domain-containing histidine kinase [Microthrixaceae bacterium]